jgi:UDP-N-acetylmuramate dehydrogenase
MIRIDDSNPGQVTLGAAVSLPAAARQLVAHQLTGFEWAVGVPGTIGGAIAMNAGGHGSDMAASVMRATVLDTRTGERSVRSAADLQFGYRCSAITSNEIVLDAKTSPGVRTPGRCLRIRRVTRPAA